MMGRSGFSVSYNKVNALFLIVYTLESTDRNSASSENSNVEYTEPGEYATKKCGSKESADKTITFLSVQSNTCFLFLRIDK
jgi:hypothetical protein